MKHDDKDEPGGALRVAKGLTTVLLLFGPVAGAATSGGHITEMSASTTWAPADNHELPGSGGVRIPGAESAARGTALTHSWLTGLPAQGAEPAA